MNRFRSSRWWSGVRPRWIGSWPCGRGGCWRSVWVRGWCLSQIAPVCVEYWGTDFSAPTIQTLQAAVAGQSWGDRVQLLTQPAHVTEALPQGYFDTIIFNSVVQYFPSAGYLAEVIDNAMDLLAPGGTLFIGDVRNHSLQGAFQTAVALARTTPPATPPRSANGCSAPCSANPNCCWPQSFSPAGPLIIRRWPGWTSRSNADGPTTNSTGTATTSSCTRPPPRSVRWPPRRPGRGRNARAWAGCTTQLVSDRPAAVRVTEIPRAGLISDVHLEHGSGRRAAAGRRTGPGRAPAPLIPLLPEHLHRLGETTGYHVAVTWGAQPGTLDAVFIAPTDATAARPAADRPLPARRRGPPPRHPRQ